MNEYSFTIPTAAFSINKSTYTDKRHKTQAFRNWEQQFNIWLGSHVGELCKLQGPTFAIEMNFEYPRDMFYNKGGVISSKTFDLSNVEKPIQDLIFKAMDKNDKLIVSLNSLKYPGCTHAIHIRIQCLNSELHPHE